MIVLDDIKPELRDPGLTFLDIFGNLHDGFQYDEIHTKIVLGSQHEISRDFC